MMFRTRSERPRRGSSGYRQHGRPIRFRSRVHSDIRTPRPTPCFKGFLRKGARTPFTRDGRRGAFGGREPGIGTAAQLLRRNGMRFDLLIKNGTVIDPAAGMHAQADLAVVRGRVAAIDKEIPAGSAAQLYDAAGCYVTPGLIDLHTHIFHKVTFWGVNADVVAARSGVTTWVDAGSSGAFTMDGFREFIVRPAIVRIYAFLNISCIGLVAHDYELTNLAFCNPDLFELMLNANRDLVIGGKVRLGASTVGENGFEPLKLARDVLDRCELPVMLHIADRPPHPEEFVGLLRPGDVLTHCFTGWDMRLVDEHGKMQPFARQWIDRGVLLDVGHGTGSLTFATAQAMLAAGIKPHFISSDIHQNSMRGPMYDLPTCLNKF